MRSVTPRLLLLSAGFAACATVFACDSHSSPEGVRIEGQSECASCHLGEFEFATIRHQTVNPTPTTDLCPSCHSTEAWRPAGLHPEAAFPITSDPHQDIHCVECHLQPGHVNPLSTTLPGYTEENVNCIRCHVRSDMDPSHDTVPDYAWNQSDPDFCRLCHPTGVGAGHPEDEFPIENGAHDEPCVECHIQILQVGYTEANVSCTASTADGGCHKHTQSSMDDKHNEENGYSYDTAACLDCHPRGRE